GPLAPSRSIALPRLRVLAQDVANFRVALALAAVLALLRVEAEAGQVERANGHLDDLLAIRGDDRLFGDDVAEVFLDRLFDLGVVPRLVGRPLAVQRPVLLRNGYGELHWR